MGFVYPYFLFALFAVAIPIVIHLFNFRRFKKVYFTNVKLLKDLKIESRKQSKIRNLLLLCLRCLSIVFLVLLFANPYIKQDENALVKEGSNAVLIFVDNSFSMENSANEGSLLDIAKVKAKEIAMQYSEKDNFCLLTQDMSGKHKHFVDREQFLSLLSEVEISAASLPMSQITLSSHRFINTNTAKNKVCFYISDFQSSRFDAENFETSNLNDVFVPLKAENADNVFIDSVWFENRGLKVGEAADLFIKISNRSQDSRENLPVKLFIEEKLLTAVSVNLGANEQQTIKMSFTVPQSGVLHSKVSLSDNPVCFDDDFYFTLLIREKVKVLAINQNNENKHLLRLLKNDESIEFSNMRADNLDFGNLQGQSMIILNGLSEISSGLSSELSNFIERGGSLCVIPSKDMDLQSYNNFLTHYSAPCYESFVEKTAKVASIDIENKLFKGVFSSVTDNMEKPEVRKYFRFSKTSSSIAQSIMQFADGEDFLVWSAQNKSDIYLFASALEEDWCNIVNQSIFVPTLWNMCSMSRILPPIYYYLGDNSFIDLSAYLTLDNKEICTVKNKSEDISFIPQLLKTNKQIGLLSQGQTKRADNYNIWLNDSLMGGFSLNYSRQESVLEFYNNKDLAELLEKNNIRNSRVFSSKEMIETQFQKSKVGVSFTSLLIFLTLICIGLEIFLLNKNSKHQY